MGILIRWRVYGVLILSQTGVTLGQPGPENDLELLIRDALAKNPGLAALHEQEAADRERIAPAGSLPDPMVEGTFQNARFPEFTFGKDDMSEFGVELRQGWLQVGRREARRQAAGALAAVRGQEREMAGRNLVREIRRNFAVLYQMDRELDFLSSVEPMLAGLEHSASSRYAAGEAELESPLKARLMQVELRERRDELAAQRALTLAALNRLARRPMVSPLPSIPELPATPFPPEEEWTPRAKVHTGVLSFTRAQIEEAERRIEAARWELKPTYSGGGYTGVRGSSDPVVAVKIGIEWPARKREKQEPEIRAIEHETSALRQQLAALEIQVEEEVTRLQIQRRNTELQAGRLRDLTLPLSQAALDAARIAYESGRGDFATVIEDFQRWLEARIQLVRREAEGFMVWADLQALIEDTSTVPAAGERP